MRKLNSIIATLLFLITGGLSAYAANWPLDELADLETRAFSHIDSSETIPDRLEALENKLLGAAQTGSLAARLATLKECLREQPMPPNVQAPATRKHKEVIQASVSENQIRPAIAPPPNKNTSIPMEQKSLATIAPHDAHYFFARGMETDRKNDIPEALVNYVLSWNLDPDNPLYKSKLDSTESKIRLTCPNWHMQSYYFPDRADPRALLNYGVRLYSIGWYKQAQELFTRAAWTDPKNPNAYYNLAAIAERQGQYADAQELYARAENLFKVSQDDTNGTYTISSWTDAHGRIVNQPGASSKYQPSLRADIGIGNDVIPIESRRYSGTEDAGTGSILSSEAFENVTHQPSGRTPSYAKEWPIVNALGRYSPVIGGPSVNWPIVDITGIPRKQLIQMHIVDTCDRCRIVRLKPMGPH